MNDKIVGLQSDARAFLSRAALESKKYAHPYYIFNVSLAVSFMFLRLVKPFCTLLFKDTAESGPCALDLREHEVLIFVGCITVIKNRGAPTWQHYLKKFATYAKVANVYLFWRQHPAQGLIYLAICAVQIVFFPEPIYSGPQKIEYFSGLENMEKTIREDTRSTWLVCFYTTWSMKCIDMAPVFAEISGKYWLPNFRFGKIDVGRYSEVAQKYRIGTGAWTRQLPTIMLFKDGQPHTRRPYVDAKGQVPKYEFAVPTVIQDFDLNNEYEACKSRLGKKVIQDLEEKKTS
ncbi:thioredoxin-related transmembrane protein 2 homolog [Paramacrobiotus metropolitanus]|uniref:thioredoxin-related transmembrane protein 2 homolog n=1 Tax=Paramacrobiotus metropolitanus TaxID=2943436 RepID=UPI002446488B|nr:thioredoxin-related transmembrane protein 2 homolog [Paramacrobiotus metropolitanus]